MAHTAVQELSEPTLACRVAFGTPERSVAGARGTIALFSPGSMVAYLIDNRGKFAFFVFRTLPERQMVGARIEGVEPHVDLILATKRRRVARRALTLLGWVARTHAHEESVPDAFWIRAACIIGDRRSGALPFDPSALFERLRRDDRLRSGASRSDSGLRDRISVDVESHPKHPPRALRSPSGRRAMRRVDGGISDPPHG